MCHETLASRFRLDSWPRDDPGVELHILQGDALMMSATVRQLREFSLMVVDLPRGLQVRNINDIRFSSMHVRAMVTQFARLTIASEWRVVVMHGPEDVASVRDALQAVCNAGIESAVWIKTNVRGQSRKRLTDAEEYITIGHMDHSNSSKRNVKLACAHGRNCPEPREKTDMTNVFAYSAVNRKLRFPGSSRAANMYQKPVKLVRQLVRLYSKAGSWVLDMCSGSGTGAVSALLERRNVIAVDVDPKQVAFVKARIQSLGTLPDEDQEIGPHRDPWSVHEARSLQTGKS